MRSFLIPISIAILMLCGCYPYAAVSNQQQEFELTISGEMEQARLRTTGLPIAEDAEISLPYTATFKISDIKDGAQIQAQGLSYGEIICVVTLNGKEINRVAVNDVYGCQIRF